MTQEQFQCGVIPSPEDIRDYAARDFINKKQDYPKTLDMRSELQPVRRQGKFGTCSAFTSACMKEWQEYHDANKLNEYVSVWYIYNQRNKGKFDYEGMYPRETMKILLESGSVKESEYPYTPEHHNEDVPNHLIDKGTEMRIKSYAKVRTPDELKQSLFVNGVCYAVLDVKSFDRKDNKFWLTNGNNKNYGGHAVAVVGYNRKGFILRNSWGRWWNEDGYITIPYNEFKNFKELWTAVDEKNKENVKPVSKENGSLLDYVVSLIDRILKMF